MIAENYARVSSSIPMTGHKGDFQNAFFAGFGKTDKSV